MRDEWMIRGRVPMTKEEVRAVSVSKLELSPDSVRWDRGAGAGSGSVEASFFLREGQVFAVEKKPEALELIEKNKEKFGRENITVVAGEAPQALEGLPAPTHAFLGGASGHMDEIIGLLLRKNKKVRVTANIISLESLSELLACLKKRQIEAEIVSMQTARSRLAAGHHLMMGQNPVYIISFGGEESPWAEEYS